MPVAFPKRKNHEQGRTGHRGGNSAQGAERAAAQSEAIDDQILAEQYHVFPGTTLTVCALTLQNGFHVVGESAAASPSNFDEEIGRKIAFDNARNQIWKLEGYLLRSRLAETTM